MPLSLVLDLTCSAFEIQGGGEGVPMVAVMKLLATCNFWIPVVTRTQHICDRLSSIFVGRVHRDENSGETGGDQIVSDLQLLDYHSHPY